MIVSGALAFQTPAAPATQWAGQSFEITWLADTSNGTGAETQGDPQGHPAATSSDHLSALDRIFADWDNQMGDFGDF